MKKASMLLLGLVLSVLTFASGTNNGFNEAFDPLFHPGRNVPPLVGPRQGLDSLRRWNTIAINASGLDHTPVAPGENRVFGEQLGPGRSSRAMAIVHIAMFDALDAVVGGYTSYTGTHAAAGPISVDAAISQAARDTLAAMFPSQTATFDAYLAQDLALVRNAQQRANGIDLGHRAAAAILAMRLNDGSQVPEPRVGVDYFPSDQPGHWRQDPISLIPLALGAHWGKCIPFVVTSPSQFRAPPPPDMTSSDYTAAYNEVKNLGGDGVITPTQRTEEQTFIGIFWAYDGTPSLCAPPRLYNQITVQIADQRRFSAIQFARLLALVNVAMADAGMTIWESKYHYDFWRPILGIRESDPGTGPTGLGDGNPDTIGDVNFMPLGAPASNLTGPNFTPPFPAYPSGHAGFGGALFQVMRRFYGTDNIAFTFVSDEFNGQLATTMEMSGLIDRALFRLCRRPRKRTARAESILAFTGPLTRRRESPLVAASPITCSITPSRQLILNFGSNPAGRPLLVVALVNFRFRSLNVSINSRAEFVRCASVFVSPTTFGILDRLRYRRVSAHIRAIIACRAFHPRRQDRDYRQIARNAPDARQTLASTRRPVRRTIAERGQVGLLFSSPA